MELIYVAFELIQQGSEECWAAQGNAGEGLTIHTNDCFDSLDFWVLKVAVNWEAVARYISAHVGRNTSKTVNWERFIAVIRLNNTTDVEERLLILVSWAHEVKTLGACVRAITCCVIDGSCQRNLPP